MQQLRSVANKLLSSISTCKSTNFLPTCGIKYFAPPPNYDDIVLPDVKKLKVLDKVPTYSGNIKPPKMQKRLRYMRGPETVHNTLQYKQFGIIATCGGRLKHEHFEIIRMGILRNIDMKRMFAVWRVDPPWQPITKKGQGQRMGGGKGSISYYVTPVKKDRVIVEVAGKCEFFEVKKFLQGIACRMPFDAKVVSYEMMQREAEYKERKEKLNENKYTFKYLIQNNMGGCHKWLNPYDFKYYGEYM